MTIVSSFMYQDHSCNISITTAQRWNLLIFRPVDRLAKKKVPDRKFVNPTTVHCINDDPKHCQVPRCHLYNLVNPPDGKLVNPTNVQCINDDQKQVPSVICIILVNPPDGKLANPTNVRCINDDPKQVPPVICIILSFVFCTSDFESVRLLY